MNKKGRFNMKEFDLSFNLVHKDRSITPQPTLLSHKKTESSSKKHTLNNQTILPLVTVLKRKLQQDLRFSFVKIFLKYQQTLKKVERFRSNKSLKILVKYFNSWKLAVNMQRTQKNRLIKQEKNQNEQNFLYLAHRFYWSILKQKAFKALRLNIQSLPSVDQSSTPSQSQTKSVKKYENRLEKKISQSPSKLYYKKSPGKSQKPQKKDSPFKDSPFKDSPKKDSPLKDSPIKDSPVKDPSVKNSSIHESPIKDSPVKMTQESPNKESPGYSLKLSVQRSPQKQVKSDKSKTKKKKELDTKSQGSYIQRDSCKEVDSEDKALRFRKAWLLKKMIKKLYLDFKMDQIDKEIANANYQFRLTKQAYIYWKEVHTQTAQKKKQKKEIDWDKQVIKYRQYRLKIKSFNGLKEIKKDKSNQASNLKLQDSSPKPVTDFDIDKNVNDIERQIKIIDNFFQLSHVIPPHSYQIQENTNDNCFLKPQERQEVNLEEQEKSQIIKMNLFIYEIKKNRQSSLKKLGGKAQAQETSSKLQEFEQLYSQCSQKAKNISILQKDRDDKIKKYGTDSDSIELGVAIREELQGCETLIKQMVNVMQKQRRKMKQYQENEIIVREEYLSEIKYIVKNLKKKEFGEVDSPKYAKVQTFQKIVQSSNRRVELTSQEEQAMERWDENDKQMDKKLDEIIVGADRMKENALKIGEQIDQRDEQIGKLIKEVDKANEQVSSQNKQLKLLVQQVK